MSESTDEPIEDEEDERADAHAKRARESAVEVHEQTPDGGDASRPVQTPSHQSEADAGQVEAAAPDRKSRARPR